MVRNVVTAIAAALLAAGCGSIGTANVETSYKPGAKGLLVASVTASGYNPGTLWFQVVPTGAVTQTVASIPVNDATYGLDWSRGDPAVPNGGVGRVAVVELGPGDYEIRRWVINVSNREAVASVRGLGYRFTIEAGKATYLGNLHLDLQRTASEDTVPFAASLEDRRSRDLLILHSKYPGVRPEQVIFAAAGMAREPIARSRRVEDRGPTRIDDLQNLLPGK